MHRIVSVAASAAVSLLGVALAVSSLAGAVRRDRPTAWVLTTDGRSIEGQIDGGAITFTDESKSRELGLNEILTVQTGGAASTEEMSRITADLAAVAANTDRTAREAATAELTDIGVPVISPLLAIYKDTDDHEPKPLFRLFARIIPGYADRKDRALDLVRLATGETLRGHVAMGDLRVTGPDRTEIVIPGGSLRRLAIRRRTIDKTFDVQALQHCTPIEFLDSRVGVSAGSRIEETAHGFVRLSFDIDGWAADADGIKVPGPNYKTNLVDGFPFGALVGRVGAAGPRWLAGQHVRKSSLERGRLFFAVNDNGHWQNNIGSFRVHLRATDAYDLGDPQ